MERRNPAIVSGVNYTPGKLTPSLDVYLVSFAFFFACGDRMKEEPGFINAGVDVGDCAGIK